MTATRDFKTAFVEHFPRAMRVARSVGADDLAAEDIAAETLARAYARWSKLTAGDYLEAWIVRVATNLALNALRDGNRRLGPSASSAPLEVADQATAAVTVAAALRRLPKRQREAVVLCHLGGLSEAEAARVLRVSPNTVKTHAQRGMAALRGQFREPPKEFATWPISAA
jgi:RNA polymerase sigma factor (sigma-70 family)